MEDYRKIISENLVRLRKEKKWTQIDIAEKLNYSNKAVSRWEKGEVIPDVETLSKIADLYEIKLTDLFKEWTPEEKITQNKSFKIGNKLTISLLSVLAVWLCATVVYVYIQLIFNIYIWQVFMWAVPISFIIALIFNCIWGKRIWTFVFISLLVWSILACFYFQLLSYNLWLIFTIGIPLQLGIILWANLKKKHKKN